MIEAPKTKDQVVYFWVEATEVAETEETEGVVIET